MANSSKCTNSSVDANTKEHLITASFLSTIGLLGNVFVIVLILREKQRKSTTTYLLLSLAVADIVNLLGIETFAFLEHLMPKHAKESYRVRLITIPARVVANLTLGLIALERYNALVRAMRPFVAITKKKITIGVIVSWLVGAGVSLPSVICEYGQVHGGGGGTYAHKQFLGVLLLVGCIVPLVLVAFCYSSILKGLFLDGTILGQRVTEEATMKEKKQLLRTLLVITLVFLTCNVPAAIILLLENYGVSRWNWTLQLLLASLSSGLNPYIYGLRSQKHRSELKELLCKSCCRENDNKKDPTETCDSKL